MQKVDLHGHNVEQAKQVVLASLKIQLDPTKHCDIKLSLCIGKGNHSKRRGKATKLRIGPAVRKILVSLSLPVDIKDHERTGWIHCISSKR